ncbi:hypothetical protein ACWDRX_36830, partial [Streptomyces nigra]
VVREFNEFPRGTMGEAEQVVAVPPEGHPPGGGGGVRRVSFNIDTGGLAARRILARLVEEGAKPEEKVK